MTDGADYDIKAKNYKRSIIGEYSFFEGKLFRYDDYGNYNYGVAAKAFGLSKTLALFGAGVNQTLKAITPTGYGIIHRGFIIPVLPIFGKIDLMSPSNINGFFDDPKDTYMIKEGYSR